MSATQAPEPEGGPDRDREVLDRIAGYENGADPAFVARLRAPVTAPGGGLGLDRIIQIVVLLGLLALILPGPWPMVAALLAGPTVAALFGLRTARRAARTMKPPAA
ncbi:hypothetical protein [Pseudonocardia sp. KRD291]|uniref:hypothetical protein n=1 Tax=Pseudonocardia sp. KRD291 TaxID=2792007 RepID=UPI001C49CDFA|nr:hypothetical protein [Pseudonocardia sp. KRD291]MBW0104806.1 hypothetical protein [Pseudonocardia sp. KRD291]